MSRYIAFLRAINVGGRTVTMHQLREHFLALGFTSVATVIASGNVVFETTGAAGRALERTIEDHLAGELGFEVGTFLRTARELAQVVRGAPFGENDTPDGGVVYAIFLRDKPPVELVRRLEGLTTDTNEARAGLREVYWLRRERGPASDAFGARLGKLLGAETTSRNMTTVRKIADTYC